LITKIRYIINAYIALFIYLFSRKRDDIWVIGGHNGRLYTDNAKVFYEYIVDNHPNIEIYWFVNSDATIHNQIRGKKITKGSIRGYLHFYRSKVALFSNTLNLDLAPFSFILPLVRGIYKSRLKVYLGHGTIAFKKMPQFSGAVGDIKRAIFRSYDLAIASTLLEKIAMEGYGIEESNIYIRGSARYDKLYSTPSDKKVILIAPTWRGWLVQDSTIKESDFFLEYTKLLTNPSLIKYLQSHNIYIEFYLHHLFHNFYGEFRPYGSSNITILAPDANISKSIMSSKLLITDYSSISADFYYLKKPVLFFQFDRDRYIDEIGSEIDLVDDSFGEVLYSVNKLVDSTISTMDNHPILPKKQRDGEKYLINFKDRDNCMRIYDTIQKKLLGEL
jgi:CDP-glycerol glycerophosphotransferase (TagB/SpsB family)